MSGSIPTVAIVGRTNVGKSTLFNTLIGRRLAVVEGSHGVTRDRHYGIVKRGDLHFTLIDTGGLFGEEDREGSDGYRLRQSVFTQTELAIEESDLVLVVFDGVEGPHPHDSEVVDLIRRRQKPVIWVVNKTEKQLSQLQAAEFYGLGIDELHCISAAHKLQTRELVALIQKRLSGLGFNPRPGLDEAIAEREAIDAAEAEFIAGYSGTAEQVEADESDPAAEEIVTTKAPDRPIKIAVLGKPNVGKSTLINKILGADRLVTSSVAGTTRDNIDIHLSRDGQEFVLVDTAGLRKKARVKSVSAERYSNLRALRALAGCDIAVLLLDATEGLPSEQDLKIAGIVHERGRGLMIVLNKWDAIEKDHRTAKAFKDGVQQAFRFTRYAPVLFVSALTGRRCPAILDTAREIYQAAHQRVKTSEINKVLGRAFQTKPPPAHRAEPAKLFFATQIDVAPPTFVLFVNNPARLAASYERYLKNTLREVFPFTGVDIKFILKKRTERAERNQARL